MLISEVVRYSKNKSAFTKGFFKYIQLCGVNSNIKILKKFIP